MNKKLICFLCLNLCLPVAWANIDVDATAKVLYEYLGFRKVNIPKAEQLAELKRIEQTIDQGLEKDPNNSKLWWLKGLNYRSYVFALQEPLSEEEKKQKKKYKYELKNAAFRKAIELDKSQLPQLTLDALYSLTTFGSSDVHVEAAHRIFKEDPYLEPRKELDMRGGVIQHLLRLERYDDVIKEIEIIEQKFPDTEYAKGARSHYTEVIEKAKQTTLAKKDDQPKTPKQKETVVAVEQPKPQAVKGQSPKQTPSSAERSADVAPSAEADITRNILIWALLAIGLVVILYIIRRPRKK